jgi:ATP dependent DNA ligase domain
MYRVSAGFVAPCLPTKAPHPPTGEAWLHEIKHDGFRVIARKIGYRVKLYSRPGNDFTYRFPLIVETLSRLRSRASGPGLTTASDRLEGRIAQSGVFRAAEEPDAVASLGQNIGQRCLADFERIVTQVVAVQLDQVEGVSGRTISECRNSH